MATGYVQRYRIVKSEQGVTFFLPKRFIFIFISFLFVSWLFRFVSVSEEYRFVSFHELEICFPFRFVSFQKIMRFLRFVPFRFVSFLNPVKNCNLTLKNGSNSKNSIPFTLLNPNLISP
jgi:hypothetical protein